MWYNAIVMWILRSPLHVFISESILLITYRGRRSRRIYTTPVNYVRDGNFFLVTSFRHRVWWRNLRGGIPVTVRVQGRDLRASAEVFEDDASVAARLTTLLQNAPRYGRYFRVKLDAGGQPDAEDLLRAARERVVVRLAVGISLKDTNAQPVPAMS